MSQVHVSADEVSKMAGAFALGLCLMALISVAIIRLMGLEMRAYLPPLIFPITAIWDCLFVYLQLARRVSAGAGAFYGHGAGAIYAQVIYCGAE